MIKSKTPVGKHLFKINNKETREISAVFFSYFYVWDIRNIYNRYWFIGTWARSILNITQSKNNWPRINLQITRQINKTFLLTVKKKFNRVLSEYLFHASRTSLMALNSAFIEQRVVNIIIQLSVAINVNIGIVNFIREKYMTVDKFSACFIKIFLIWISLRWCPVIYLTW